MAVLPEGKGKTAVTDYETLTHYGSDYTLCRFTLQTGRTHQIRVHAKYMGHPSWATRSTGYAGKSFLWQVSSCTLIN